MKAFQKLQRFADRIYTHFERWAFRDWPRHCDDYDIIPLPKKQRRNTRLGQ